MPSSLGKITIDLGFGLPSANGAPEIYGCPAIEPSVPPEFNAKLPSRNLSQSSWTPLGNGCKFGFGSLFVGSDLGPVDGVALGAGGFGNLLGLGTLAYRSGSH